MQFWEQPGNAEDIHARANARLKRHDIAPTPINYELWFHYELGHDPDLKRALEAVLHGGEASNNTRAREIHTRFFVRSDHSVEQTNAKVCAELGQLGSSLSGVRDDARGYLDALRDVGERIEQARTASDFAAAARQAANATREMESNQNALLRQVERSSHELEAMRCQLEAIRQENHTDSLTGLATRRAFEDGIDSAIHTASETREPLCLLLCDLDDFKIFNDTWGHSTGDQVLRLTSSILKASIKGKDLAARYSGEEFAITLPNTTLANAVIVAEQIRSAIHARTIVKKSSGESLGSVSVSIGVAQHVNGELLDMFAGRAEYHLTVAQKAGGNQVRWLDSVKDQVRSAAPPFEPPPAAVCAAPVAKTPLIELEFSDRDTPLIIHAEVTPTDARLSRVLDWWTSICANEQVPLWVESHFSTLGDVRDCAHLHESDDVSEDLLVRFVGSNLVKVLGTDPTGYRYSSERSPVVELQSSAERMFALVRLTRQLASPLYACSKGTRHLAGGNYTSEVLLLPFRGQGGIGSVVLGVTIYTSVSRDGAQAA